MKSKNILVFTGERLSGVVNNNLPENIEVNKINVERDVNLKDKIHHLILRHSLSNLFVFIAYRALETYLLTTVDKSVNRHLVQDGANFYFRIDKSMVVSRVKETIKIYRNLWMNGILLKKLVLFKKHMAQCGFIDNVWLTNPEVYREPRFYKKPTRKINLLSNRDDVTTASHYFGVDKMLSFDNTLIYLSSRLKQEDIILLEISQLKLIFSKLNKPNLLVKLHPNSPALQVDLFTEAFGDSVVMNYIPAELYIASATNSAIIGCVSAALYYRNPACVYYSVLNIYQQLGIFLPGIAVNFPAHIRVLENLDELEPFTVN